MFHRFKSIVSLKLTICWTHHLFVWMQRLQNIRYVCFRCTFLSFRFRWRARLFLLGKVWLSVKLFANLKWNVIGFIWNLLYNFMDFFSKLFWLRKLPTHMTVLIRVIAFELKTFSLLTKILEVYEMKWCKKDSYFGIPYIPCDYQNTFRVSMKVSLKISACFCSWSQAA